jgi:hypothetical protein
MAGEIEVFQGNLPQCHFVHHKYHMPWPPQWKAGLSYGTAMSLPYLRQQSDALN